MENNNNKSKSEKSKEGVLVSLWSVPVAKEVANTLSKEELYSMSYLTENGYLSSARQLSAKMSSLDVGMLTNLGTFDMPVDMLNTGLPCVSLLLVEVGSVGTFIPIPPLVFLEWSLFEELQSNFMPLGFNLGEAKARFETPLLYVDYLIQQRILSKGRSVQV